MTKIILIYFLLLTNFAFAEALIACKTRYQYLVFHPAVEPAYTEGTITGRQPIAGTGRDAYYEKKWSSLYTITIPFYSGFELNKGKTIKWYKDEAIIVIVSWDNGGKSYITINDWTTSLEIMTENEVKFDTNGKPISYMTGYDTESRFWEFYF